MKRILSALLVCVLVLSLGACGKTEIHRGEVTETGYTSKTNGVTFSTADEWEIASDEQIATLLQTSADELAPDKFSKTAATYGVVYDMIAFDGETGASVILGYHNLLIAYDKVISEKEYIDKVSEEAGMPLERSERTLGSHTYTCGSANVTDTGSAYEQVYCVRSLGDYMFFIVITVPAGYDMQSVENMFS